MPLSGTHRAVDFRKRNPLQPKELQLEAGGIEPPSRDISAGVSTCVVVWFNLGRPAPSDRLRLAQCRGSLTRVSRHLPSRACLLSSPRQLAGITDGTGRLVRRPCATCCRWQLLVVSGVLPGLLTTWARGHDLICPVEPKSPPSLKLSIPYLGRCG